MKDQSSGNDIDGDVSGTSIQAGSIGGDVYVNAPRKLLRRKAFRYLAVPAAAVVVASTLALVKLVAPDETAHQTPTAVTTSTETVAKSSPASTGGTPATSTAAGVARPAPDGPTTRPAGGTPIVVAPAPTAAVAVPPPPPADTGVRFSGALQFGSFHLDLVQPRDMPGMNVWRMPQNRLHGDDTYELAEWIGDGVPGQAECAADLVRRATRDAENLIIGSRVCGKTPGGRIFRVDVVTIDHATITGQVTVWE